MLSTLFFEEREARTTLKGRQATCEGLSALDTQDTEVLQAMTSMQTLGDGGAVQSRHGCLFSSRGQVLLASLNATLLWWLDADTAALRLLAVHNAALSSAVSSAAPIGDCRLLTVHLRLASRQLLTCGVTKSSHADNTVIVAWLTREGLQASYLTLTIQREYDTTEGSRFMLTQGEPVVQCHLRPYISGAFDDRPESYCSACVVAEVSAEEVQTAAVVVLTDRRRLWRAALLFDGTAVVRQCYDDRGSGTVRYFCDDAESTRQLNLQGMASRMQLTSFFASSPTHSEPDAGTPTDLQEEGRPSSGADQPRRSWLPRWLSDRGNGATGTFATATSQGSEEVPQSPVERGSPMRMAGPSVVPPTPPAELYTAVSAVLESSYVAVTRWNGQVEIYSTEDGEWILAKAYPIGIMPRELLISPVTISKGQAVKAAGRLPAGPAVQWAVRSSTTSHVIHVVCCVGGTEGRRCFWLTLPLVPDHRLQSSGSEKVVALNCTQSIPLPTLSAVPLSCAVTADGCRLALISDAGSEEDGHLLCALSIGSLTLRGQSAAMNGVSTVVQLVEMEAGGGYGTAQRVKQAPSYLCHGARMQAVLAQQNQLVVVERGPLACRVHAMEAVHDPLQRLVEVALVSIDEDDMNATALRGYAPPFEAGSAMHCVHYVPLDGCDAADLVADEANGGEAAAYAMYWEGVRLMQSCAHGAVLMADMMEDILSSASTLQHSTAVSRLLSEAQLSGYAPSTTWTAEAALAVIEAAVGAAAVPSQRSFFHHSRRYIANATSRDILCRVAFLATSYLGWMGPTATGKALAASSYADPATQQLSSAIEVLLALYHAIPAAGPDIVRLASINSACTMPTAAAVVGALLPDVSSSGGISALGLVSVANRLGRCATPRAANAQLLFANSLLSHFPLLQHYCVVWALDMQVAATQSSSLQRRCQSIAHDLAMRTTEELTELLVMDGLLLVEVGGTGSSFINLSAAEISSFVIMERTMAPKLYSIGVLRRATPSGALQLLLATCVARGYFYAVLVEVLEVIHARHRRLQGGATTSAAPLPFAGLCRALEELQIDLLLVFALSAVGEGDMGGCFHDLQLAMELMEIHQTSVTYANSIGCVLGRIIEVACSSVANMNALQAVTTNCARLDELLLGKWYNYIARLPTRSASPPTEALRYRAITGLHLYLMNRHHYAQCARIMSDLATLIRCSPLRRSAAAGISVGELAGLALHAATLIAPPAPVGSEESEVRSAASRLHGSPISLGSSWVSGTTNAIATSGAAAASPMARWLTREDIPWLQRRLYQAHCERLLWRCGSALDCTDLWVDGAPATAYSQAVSKLVGALMENRLWPEAYRYSTVSEAYDGCCVLMEWAVDLVQQARHILTEVPGEAAIAAEDLTMSWAELTQYCGELSNLKNQFSGYVRTITAALAISFEFVPPSLLAAHRAADPYTAMSTLLQASLQFRKRAGDLRVSATFYDDDDAAETEREGKSPRDSEDGSPAGPSSTASSTSAAVAPPVLVTSYRRGDAASLRMDAVRSWAAAASIAVEVLRPGFRTAEPTPSTLAASFTAGVMDPLSRAGREMMSTAIYRDCIAAVPGAAEVCHDLQQLMRQPCQ